MLYLTKLIIECICSIVSVTRIHNLTTIHFGFAKQVGINSWVLEKKIYASRFLRAASPKYRLNLEIAKKWNFFKLAQNEVFRALVTKKIV